MKTLFISLILFIVLIASASALSEAENQSVAGRDINYKTVEEQSISLQEQLLEYQENNAVNDVQLGSEEISVAERKKQILADASYMWLLIGGLIYLFIDVIKIVFYLFEMWLFCLFVFKLLPEFMIKIKEAIVTWYQDK